MPYLCYNEISLSDIPADGSPELKTFLDAVYAEADELLVGTEEEGKHPDWDFSKPQAEGTVACKTRKARKGLDNGLKWHLRTSYHQSPSFDTFRKYMQTERLENVQKYMSSMEELVILGTPAEGMGAFYTVISLGLIGAKREFGGVAIQRNFEGENRFQIITIPLLTKETKGGVKGLYSAVEDFKEVHRDGKTMVQWRKAALSSPRGSIPQFLSEKSIEQTISKDVNDFVQFAKQQGLDASVESVV